MDVKKTRMVRRFGGVAVATLFVCQLGAAELGNSYLVQNLVSDGSVAKSPEMALASSTRLTRTVRSSRASRRATR